MVSNLRGRRNLPIKYRLGPTLLLLVSLHAYGADPVDRLWICASDDDPRGVFVNYPARGAATVQVAGKNYIATVKEADDEEGDRFLRFDFDEYNQAVRLMLSRDKDASKTNIYVAGLFDFSDTEEGGVEKPILFACAEKVPVRR